MAKQELTAEEKKAKREQKAAQDSARVIKVVLSQATQKDEVRSIVLGGTQRNSVKRTDLEALVAPEGTSPKKAAEAGQITKEYFDWIVANTDIVIKGAGAVTREPVVREYPVWIDSLVTVDEALVEAGKRFNTALKAFEAANTADLELFEKTYGQVWKQYFRADKSEKSPFHNHPKKEKETADEGNDEANS